MTANQQFKKTSLLTCRIRHCLLTAILAGACTPAGATRSGGAGACVGSAAAALVTGIDGDLGGLYEE